MLPRILSALTSLFLLLPTAAQETAAITIGGTGSLSSEGFDDPGLLSDGETQARARLQFTLDVSQSRLTLEVANLSPVLEGVPNPVLTRIYFNAPEEITGMSLQSQSAAQGASAFSLVFDPDRVFGRQPNRAGRLGAFSAKLDNGAGVGGGIANPLADTLPTQDVVLGPVTFVIALQGDLSGVSVMDFVTERSSNPTGKARVIAAGKFQGGGDDDASAFISNDEPVCLIAAMVEDLGGGCGARLECDLPVMDQLWHARIDSDLPGALGVLILSRFEPESTFVNGCEILLDLESANPVLYFQTDANGDAELELMMPSFLSSPECCGFEHLLQVVIASGGTLAQATNACHTRLGS